MSQTDVSPGGEQVPGGRAVPPRDGRLVAAGFDVGALAEGTMSRVFFEAAVMHGEVHAVTAPHRKPKVEFSYGEMARFVRAFGAGLLSYGIEPGDRIALFSDNRPEWLVADLAIMSIGAVEVPRGSDTTTTEFEFILEHSGAVAAIIEDQKLYRRLSSSPKVAALKLVILLDNDTETLSSATPAPTKFLQYGTVLDAGYGQMQRFDAAALRVRPETLASIVYTSGTTGSPKGVMLTHGNFAGQANTIDFGDKLEAGEILLSILPTWHAYERAVEYYVFKSGVTISYTDKRHLKTDLALNVRPHLFPCVPRIWETVYDAIHDRVEKTTEGKKRMFRFFKGAGLKWIRANRVMRGLDLRRKPASAFARGWAALTVAALWPIHKLGDALVFSKLREAITGGRIRAAVSGGGSLPAHLDDFFDLAGVPLLNGYGLTETSPVLSVRRTDKNVRGTVGPPIAGTSIEVRDDAGKVLPQGQTGIIFARGQQVMRGYYNNEEATRKVLSDDGWFNTGDLGYIAATGELAITGRAKDTIVLASGENVEPDPIENVARRSPLVSQIMVVGQDRNVLAALIVPNREELARALGTAEAAELTELVKDSRASKLVRDSVSKMMAEEKSFKASEQISKVALLDEAFSEENGLLTNTMKIKRNVVAERYANLIHSLYER